MLVQIAVLQFLVFVLENFNEDGASIQSSSEVRFQQQQQM